MAHLGDLFAVYVGTLSFRASQTSQMERSLAFDLHIRLCLPADISSNKTADFTPKTVTQFCCWAVKVSITFALQGFPNNLSMQTQGGQRRGRGGNDALLLWDVATPRRHRLGSGVLTAAQIPGDDGKKYERKLQGRVTGASCCAKRVDPSQTVARNTPSEIKRILVASVHAARRKPVKVPPVRTQKYIQGV